MRRLREERDVSDPAIARLTEMTKAARPLDRSAARQERVRAALVTQKRTRPRRAMVLRPAVAAVAILGSVAVASAMLGKAWVEHKRFVPSVAPPPRHIGSARPSAQPIVSVPAPPLPIPIPDHPPLVEHEASKSGSRPSRAPQIEATPIPTTAPIAIDPPAAPLLRASASHEAAMVAGAVKALRGDHDAKRAHRLFEEYLRRYPQGVLAEEALALAVEAAAAHDDPKAAKLGTEYLRRYPAGRFRTVAEQARQRFGY